MSSKVNMISKFKFLFLISDLLHFKQTALKTERPKCL